MRTYKKYKKWAIRNKKTIDAYKMYGLALAPVLLSVIGIDNIAISLSCISILIIITKK